MRLEHQQLFSGLIRLHILHHAEEEPLYGNWMIEELRRHGYHISAGTLYPMLHRMERQGYLSVKTARADGRIRRVYRVTAKGRRALQDSKTKIRELFREIVGNN
ncbi:MAG: PadR family transcriptional regulator [Chthoniobacterales bacterium]|nr:MAG: PadR family transcriptional regulator [Chthoniobacterales bacterium]